MKPKTFVILEQAVEDGVRQGWYRSHKHNENPNEELVREAIEDAVMSAIHEYFTFTEDEYR